MIYEIRNYHFEPALFEDYKTWIKERAGEYLARELDLVGFWAGDDNEVTGADMDELGSANITWILRWPDRATRDEKMGTVFSSEEWGKIFEHVPGGIDSYKRMEAKFTESLV